MTMNAASRINASAFEYLGSVRHADSEFILTAPIGGGSILILRRSPDGFAPEENAETEAAVHSLFRLRQCAA